MEIIVCGANAHCLGIVAQDFRLDEKENSIVAFLDNDKQKQGKMVKAGYYYIKGNKQYLNINDTIIDSFDNVASYNYDYIVIVASMYEDIKKQLIALGVEKEKIIIYKKYIESGLSYIPYLGNDKMSFDDLLQLSNCTKYEFENHVLNLYRTSERLFKNKYRIYLLKILLDAVSAVVYERNIDIFGVKLHHDIFGISPALFKYEVADIMFDNLHENLNRIEYVEGPYEMGNVKIEDNSVVVDLGANFGLFSALAATKNPHGIIYAFEPIASTIDTLKKTANLYNNIEIIPYGVSDTRGYCDVDTSNYNYNPGAISIMNEKKIDGEVISLISLDEFVEEKHINKIDFIKADIEGAERLMLLGAKKVLKKMAPKLVICTYHYKEDIELLSFLIKNANDKYTIEYEYGKLYAEVR